MNHANHLLGIPKTRPPLKIRQSSARLPGPFLHNVMIFDGDGKELGFIIATAAKKWNAGLFPIDVGQHQNLPIFDVPKTLMENGYGMKIPVDLSVSTVVERDLYFGQLPVPRISGFKDELSGMVISNAFTVGIISPEEIERDWRKIACEEDVPVKPVILLMGAVMWGDDGHKI